MTDQAHWRDPVLVLAVVCPRCKTPAGAWCRSEYGRRAQALHLARYPVVGDLDDLRRRVTWIGEVLARRCPFCHAGPDVVCHANGRPIEVFHARRAAPADYRAARAALDARHPTATDEPAPATVPVREEYL